MGGPPEIAAAAAVLVVSDASAAVAARGRFLFALSGGSTPEPLYRLLAGPRFDCLPWTATHLIWGDERCVPPLDDRSNYALAERSGLLGRPVAGIHRMRGEEDPEAAALAYEARLVRLGESEPPSAPGAARSGAATVDLVLLGLGDDGHTASLFPGSPALLETRRAVVATEEHAGLRRLTLTLPVLLGARRVLFLVSGAGKREAVRRVLREGDPTAPATMVAQRPRGVTWIMDVAAADGEEVARC